MLDLLIPEHAYIFGLLQTDGHLRECSQNRSQLTIEINIRDKDIVDKIVGILPIKVNTFSRKRTTNFATATTIGFRICNFTFKEHIKSLGFPVGKKSHLIAEPLIDFSKLDYYRGIIDGDGSLGITKTGLPFVSLVTDSEPLKSSYCLLVKEICGVEPHPRRNKRDNVYNIAIYTENAQCLISKLYYENCFGLNRKIYKAQEALKWIRPKHMKKINFIRKRWTKEEDAFILSHSVEESATQLNRTNKSVSIRRYRLNPLVSHRRS